MKSITIHGLDEELDEKIRKEAWKEGQSLNKSIKRLLSESLGIGKEISNHREDFLDLFGSWTQQDLEAFSHATEELSRIDPKDWESYARLLSGDERVLAALGEAEVVHLSTIVMGELFSGFRGGTRYQEN